MTRLAHIIDFVGPVKLLGLSLALLMLLAGVLMARGVRVMLEAEDDTEDCA